MSTPALCERFRSHLPIARLMGPEAGVFASLQPRRRALEASRRGSRPRDRHLLVQEREVPSALCREREPRRRSLLRGMRVHNRSGLVLRTRGRHREPDRLPAAHGADGLRRMLHRATGTGDASAHDQVRRQQRSRVGAPAALNETVVVARYARSRHTATRRPLGSRRRRSSRSEVAIGNSCSRAESTTASSITSRVPAIPHSW